MLRRPDLFGETVFSEMTALAVAHDAVNLGQGFPDFEPPAFVLEAAASAARGPQQQYARGAGTPELTGELARLYGPRLARSLDAEREITITVGATEALFASVMALVEPGEEVILFEPFYDSYPANVAIAGGRCRFVPLRPQPDGSWAYDAQELELAFSAQTRLIIVNTPHNPTGKVFTHDELAHIAALCCQHDALALADEVYEEILFGNAVHERLATFPGMWDRTLTISSAGKTFSVTGWKIGWVIGPPALSLALRRIHQWIPFAVATPLQLAVAGALAEAERRGYFDQLRALYTAKRDRLVATLQAVGLSPLVPRGTYFVMADISATGFDDDVAFCRYLTEEAGVAAIPPSAFYAAEHRALARHLLRFCFCKRDETLAAADERLRRWSSQRRA